MGSKKISYISKNISLVKKSISTENFEMLGIMKNAMVFG